VYYSSDDQIYGIIVVKPFIQLTPAAIAISIAQGVRAVVVVTTG